jgi:hypothetical protein
MERIFDWKFVDHKDQLKRQNKLFEQLKICECIFEN